MLPVVGAIADRTRRKRELLAAFAYPGALATAALFFVADGRYLLGAVLFLVANVCFGASIVVYYSWLPEIAGPDERDAVSSRGWAFGYLGGGAAARPEPGLFLSATRLGLTEGEAVRICLRRSACGGPAFTVIPLAGCATGRPRTAGAAGAGARRQLPAAGATLRELRAYPQTLLFLGAYLLFNDGVQTVIGLAAQYGDRELELSQTVLISTILLVQFVAFGGALLLGRIAAALGAKRTVLGSLVVWVGVLCRRSSCSAAARCSSTLLGAAIGLVLGGTQALTRSLFAS